MSPPTVAAVEPRVLGDGENVKCHQFAHHRVEPGMDHWMHVCCGAESGIGHATGEAVQLCSETVLYTQVLSQWTIIGKTCDCVFRSISPSRTTMSLGDSSTSLRR